MIEEVTKFKTSRGQLCDSRPLAECCEARDELEDLCEVLLKMIPSEEASAEDLVHALINHHDAVIAKVSAYAKHRAILDRRAT